jgi:hypothetical protein
MLGFDPPAAQFQAYLRTACHPALGAATAARTAPVKFIRKQGIGFPVFPKFTVSSHDEELPTDKVAEVSRPYLAWSVMD